MVGLLNTNETMVNTMLRHGYELKNKNTIAKKHETEWYGYRTGDDISNKGPERVWKYVCKS